MPTQEERIAALERFQHDTIQAVQNSNMYITRHEGIMQSQEQDIKAMRSDIAGMRTDINAMRVDMHTIAAALEKILDRLPPKE